MNFKALKHELDAIFTALRDKIEAGELPGVEDSTTFIRLLRQLQQQADPNWADECDDFAYLAGELHDSIKKQDLPESIRILESLDDALAYCHQTFKD